MIAVTGPKAQRPVAKAKKRALVLESDDESDGADAASADSDSDVSGSEFGPTDAGASSDSDEVLHWLRRVPRLQAALHDT